MFSLISSLLLCSHSDLPSCHTHQPFQIVETCKILKSHLLNLTEWQNWKWTAPWEPRVKQCSRAAAFISFFLNISHAVFFSVNLLSATCAAVGFLSVLQFCEWRIRIMLKKLQTWSFVHVFNSIKFCLFIYLFYFLKQHYWYEIMSPWGERWNQRGYKSASLC